MIEIELRDFRGCERASLRVDPIALVAGRNATGKSSIAQAIGAALTGNPLVVDGVAKGSAGMLVKIGVGGAAVALSGPGGKTRVDWPSCNVTSDGKPPAANAYAVGALSLAALSARDRAAVVGVVLKADPTEEDLRLALADLGLEDHVAALAKLIGEQGWDQAHAQRKEAGAGLKGEWRRVTGVNYGSRIAAAWVPKGWGAKEEKLSEKEFVGDVARTKAAHERAVAAAAVSDAEREQLMSEANLLAARQVAVADAQTVLRATATRLDQATDARHGLPPAESEGGLPCPHCGAFVIIHRVSLVEQTLVKVVPISAAELKKRRTKIAEADGDIARLKGEVQANQRTATLAQLDLDKSVAARTQIAGLTPGDKSAGSVEATRAAVETAAARLVAYQQKTQANELREQILINDLVLGVLAADGLRAKKLGRVLDGFNGGQSLPLTQAAGWKAVAIEPDMALTYGGRPYALLSTSEQYRVRAVMQAAMARIRGDDMVVLDAANVLDGVTRSGLFQLLIAAGLSAVVCMTLTRRGQVPDLAAVNLGASYWLDNGVLEPLNPPAGKAEAA